MKDLLCKIFISEFFVQHTVLAGQCLLSKQCVPLLSLLGQCDTVLGQIGLDIFYLACQIKKLRCPKSIFWKFEGKNCLWHWECYRLLVTWTNSIASFIGHLIFYWFCGSNWWFSETLILAPFLRTHCLLFHIS